VHGCLEATVSAEPSDHQNRIVVFQYRLAGHFGGVVA
jgi:hypothetical protein